VKIITSGGIDEYEILRLNPVVDGYGVGTSIANAAGRQLRARHHGIEGDSDAKRGKCVGRQGAVPPPRHAGDVVPSRRHPAVGRRSLGRAAQAADDGGRIVRDLPPPRTIRDFVLEQLGPVSLTPSRARQRRDF